MSSVYSSRHSSLTRPKINETSKSVPQTPSARRHKPAFRTVPDSPKHNRLLSDDNGLDLEILTHKLQLYQLELEEASLRYMQRKMRSKEAEDVAAAARFLNQQQAEQVDEDDSASSLHARSKSLFAPRTSSLRIPPPATTKSSRAKRPNPLQLNAVANVKPQAIQSAALPVRRERMSSTEDDKVKRHWRRTTIAAGRDTNARIILMTSPGSFAEFDFSADTPPVPQLSISASNATTPTIMSPVTPLPLAAEDQIRRELETFALKEGPDLTRSRQSSIVSRRRLPAAFVPGPEDRLDLSDAQDNEDMVAVIQTPTAEDLVMAKKPSLYRKKSIFSRFERKNDVDAILDLYVTEEQLVKEKLSKKKSLKSRRQTFFRRFQGDERSNVSKEGAG